MPLNFDPNYTSNTIVNLVAIWIVRNFSWNLAIFPQNTSPLRSCYGNQVNTI